MNISLRIFSKFLWLLVILIAFHPINVIAQNRAVNPLKVNVQDNLLPNNNQNLTEAQKEELRLSLAKLNDDAKTQLELGNDNEAFNIFYRQLRLTRFLGIREEVEAITEVAQIAWDKSRVDDISFLTERLSLLESENTQNNVLNSRLLDIFFKGYQALGNIDKSINIQQQIVINSRSSRFQEPLIDHLETLGNLYFSKFDYFSAKPIYEELLTISEDSKSYVRQTIYLQRLSQINGRLLNLENALEYKKQLVNTHVQNERFRAIPLVQIAIANDYKSIDNPTESGNYYQEAFNLAWSLGQYAIAGDALKGLGKLYQDYGELNSALQIYQELIKVEEQSYNFYGLMETYEQIGTIYQLQNNSQEARRSFVKALQIAQQLQYRENDFIQKIEQL